VNYGMKKFTREYVEDKLAVSATARELQYGMSFENEKVMRSARF